MSTFKFAKVLYDYKAQDVKELTVNKGDVVMILDDNNNWWKVESIKGAIGVLPSNYLHKKIVKKNSLSYHFYRLKGFKITSTEENTFNNFDGQTNYYVAKFNYIETNKNELSFNRGDVIKVINKKYEKWWTGVLNNKTGKFPSSYVRVYEVSSTNIDSSIESNLSSVDKFNMRQSALVATKKEKLSSESLFASTNKTLPNDRHTKYIQSSVCNERILSEKSLNIQNRIKSYMAPSFDEESTLKIRLIWFHGNITRQVAEIILNTFNEVGRYLIRNSESKPNDLSLSVNGYDRIRHYKISCKGNVLKEDEQKSDEGASCSIGEHSFPKVGTLIEFYKINPLLKTNETCLYLTTAIPNDHNIDLC